MPKHVLNHEPVKHVLVRHVLGHEPRHTLKHVPEHVHRHVLEHVPQNRQLACLPTMLTLNHEKLSQVQPHKNVRDHLLLDETFLIMSSILLSALILLFLGSVWRREVHKDKTCL